MGIDPHTHEPSSSRPPSTRHMAQWETARLDAEARHSHSLIPASEQGDFFLRLWNSQVGEAFRKLDHKPKQTPSSSSTKCSTLTTKMESESCTSNDIDEDSSEESALQLLLDFHTDNDMSFLGQPDSYGLYPLNFF